MPAKTWMMGHMDNILRVFQEPSRATRDQSDNEGVWPVESPTISVVELVRLSKASGNPCKCFSIIKSLLKQVSF